MIPTYLYVKQHSITGLKYFGKTTSKKPHVYKGSGTYWKSHIKKHGEEHIITCLILGPYIDEEEIKRDALYFSEQMNIVESDEWANLVPENGLNCGSWRHMIGRNIWSGRKHSEETKKKMREVKLGIKPSPESNEKRRKTQTGVKRGKYQKRNEYPKFEIRICPYCKREGKGGNMTRYHFDNCKEK